MWFFIVTVALSFWNARGLGPVGWQRKLEPFFLTLQHGWSALCA